MRSKAEGQKSVLITGASTGIGYACAARMLAAGWWVFATVRNEADEERLSHDLRVGSGRLSILHLDVTRAESVTALAAAIQEMLGADGRLNGLVNNAGVALGGPLLHIEDALISQQFDVNLVGPFRVIKALAPLLGATVGDPHRGRIVQISSVSALRPMPFVGPYSASKAALESMSSALRMELIPYGIFVSSVQPGPIRTAIWGKAPRPEESPLRHTPYERSLRRFYKSFVLSGDRDGLPPESISALVHHALTARRPRRRYLKTPGYFSRYLLPRILPGARFDRLIAGLLRLEAHRFKEDQALRSEQPDDGGDPRRLGGS